MAKHTDRVILTLGEAHTLLTTIILHNLDVAHQIAKGKNVNWKEEVIVPYLQSAPGVGKTSICWQVAQDLHASTGLQFRGFIPAQYDPAEMAGFIFFDKDSKVTWRAAPDFMPKDGAWLLLGDEFAQATMMQKNIMAQLIQERRLGEHELSKQATLVLAGNYLADRAGVQPTPSHVVDRLMLLNIEAKIEDWLVWAAKNNVRPEVIAYLRFRSSWFQKFDPAAEKNTTPRGWAKTSAILNQNLPASVELAAIAGTIGMGAAMDFSGFLKVARDLPDPDYLIAHPKDGPMPAQGNSNAMYALCGALSYRMTPANVGAVITITKRMPPEFGAMVVTDATNRDPALNQTKAVNDWKIQVGAPLLVM